MTLFVLLAGYAAVAQTKTLTNADVVEMLRAELPESTIVLSIQQSKTDFDLSPDGLIKLKKDGATQSVLDAMLRSSPAGPGTYREDPFGTSVGSSVVLVEGGVNRRPLKRMTPTSRTNNAVRAIPYAGIFLKGKTYAVFNGPRSEVRTVSTIPEIELGISSDIRISEAIFLIRLDPEKKTRRAEVERMGDLGGSSGLRKKDMIRSPSRRSIGNRRCQCGTGGFVCSPGRGRVGGPSCPATCHPPPRPRLGVLRGPPRRAVSNFDPR